MKIYVLNIIYYSQSNFQSKFHLLIEIQTKLNRNVQNHDVISAT